MAAGFDIGVSFYSGYSYSPFYRAEPLSAALLQLTPCYKEETVYAFSLAKEVYGYNIRAEAGYFAVNIRMALKLLIPGKETRFISGV